ncbi:MAG: group II intron reverse transcriptase/maturase [Bryobacteraceae bacterium]
MHAAEESDRDEVPMNQPNKEAQASAEVGEGRSRSKENIGQPHTLPAQNGERVSQGLIGVRRAARERKQERFTSLLHHVTVHLLRASFYALKPKAAPGVDGMTWQEYEDGLEGRLTDLHARIHRAAYRAQPSRRVCIPKADGKQRPLGIASLEGKIVQQAVVTVLNEIYEVDFRGFSYGFRPGRNPHQALDALNVGIVRKQVNWILDADIKGFFDNVSHEWLMKFLGHRIADRRILRLIQKWLTAGVLEDGERSDTEQGTPQGAVVSPLLANVYLHYVFDLWAEVWREKVASGDMIVVRYADDLVAGFQHRADAERFLKEFQERLAKFGLELHPGKTRLIEFGRQAWQNRKRGNQAKLATFTFLGFTHYCGENSKGYFQVWRETATKRMRAKLAELKQALRSRMHESIPETGKWLQGVVKGYCQYHAVPGNIRPLSLFRVRLCRLWRHVLRRRSQTAKVSWDVVGRIVDRWIPAPRILHPYPDARFDARIRARSRMR